MKNVLANECSPSFVALLAAFATLAIVSAQTPSTQSAPVFAVASVKPTPPGRGGSSLYGPQANGYRAYGVSLAQLIQHTYRLEPYQLIGGPNWVRREPFSVEAKYPDGWSLERGGYVEALQMVRALLAERFKLQVHTETRQGTTYDMVMARDDRRLGPGLLPAGESCEPSSRRDEKAAGTADPFPCMIRSTPRSLQVNGRPLATLAARLSPIVEAPVNDRTGLSGLYDVRLEWTADLGTPSSIAGTGDDISVFISIREQLGLKLVRSQGRLEIMVIDAAERPTSN